MRSCADETAPTLSSDPHLTTKTHGPARLRRLSIKGRCYERDNGHKTHRAKRSCLLQGHYKNDDNLAGIRKRKQEAIWQSTFSFPPPLCSHSPLTIPHGDRGGNQIYIRVTQAGQPMPCKGFGAG